MKKMYNNKKLDIILNTNQGKAHADILGQCSWKNLKQKIECNPKWNTVLDNMENPLALFFDQIENTILSHVEETFACCCTHKYSMIRLTLSWLFARTTLAAYPTIKSSLRVGLVRSSHKHLVTLLSAV
jgi:hypothetical protein